MESVSAGFGLLSIVHVARFIILYFKDQLEYSREQCAFLAELQQLCVVLEPLAERLKSRAEIDPNDLWVNAIKGSGIFVEGEHIMKTLEKVKQKLETAGSGASRSSSAVVLSTTKDQIRSKWDRLVWPLIGKKETSDILNRIQRMVTVAGLALADKTQEMTLTIHRDLSTFQKDVSDQFGILGSTMSELERKVGHIDDYASNEQRRAIVQWLCPNYDVEDELRQLHKVHEPGTGEWLTRSDGIENWIKTATSQLFLVQGPPGCGKTVLSYVMTKYLREDIKHLVLTVFVNYRDKPTADTVFARLVAQLSQLDGSIPQPILEMYRKRGAQKASVDELTDVLKATLSSYFSPTFVVLDALDEFSSEKGELLESILALNKSLKLFVTSRSIPDGVSDQTLQGTRLPSSNDHDLTEYVKAGVSNLKCIRNKSDDHIRELADRVVVASSGLFLLASRHLMKLAKCPSVGLARRIHLPTTPTEDYELAFRRIREKDGFESRFALRAIMWVWCAQRELTLKELEHAVISSKNLSGQDIEDELVPGALLLDYCDGLIVEGSRVSQDSFRYGGDPGRLVQFSHLSAKEYLDCNSLEQFSDLDQLAVDCLGYVNAKHSNDSFKKWADDYETPGRYGGKPRHISTEGRGFFDYCARYWGDHATSDTSSDDLIRALDLLYNNKPVYSLASAIRRWEIRGWMDPADRISPLPTLCHIAASFGLVNLATHVKYSSEITATDVHGETPLCYCIAMGHVVAARALANRPEVSQSPGNNTPARSQLILAARRGHSEVVKVLLSLPSFDANVKDQHGRSALLYAAGKGYDDVVHVFLNQENLRVDSQDSEGRTPLSWAAQGGYFPVVVALVQKGSDPNCRDIKGRTPVSYSSSGPPKSFYETVDYDSSDIKPLESGHIFVAGDRIEKESERQLQIAKAGCMDVLGFFLTLKDADINAPDNEGLSPLSWATKSGNSDGMRLLLSQLDIDADSCDCDGRSALSWAAETNDISIVQEFLDRADVSADSRDNFGRSPLSFSARGHKPEIVKLLLSRPDVEADSRDCKGRSPLSWATGRDNIEAVQAFLERDDVDVNSKDEYGCSPLAWAAIWGSSSSTKALLSRNDIVINTEDKDGFSPLAWTVVHGNTALFRLYLARYDISPDSFLPEKLNQLLRLALDPQIGRNIIMSREKGGGNGYYGGYWERDHEHIFQEILNLNSSAEVINTTEAGTGKSLLSVAASNGRRKSVISLIDMGADINSCDHQGRNTLSWAAAGDPGADINDNWRSNNFRSCIGLDAPFEVVELLLNQPNIEADFPDNDGRTPLSLAAQLGSSLICQTLLGCQDVIADRRDKNGRSPLSWAAQNKLDVIKSLGEGGWETVPNTLEVTRILLEREDVDATQRDNSGKTPLQWAIETGHEINADIIRKHLKDKGFAVE